MSDTNVDLRAKVLIAEDDTIVALDLQGMITRLGYDVVQIVNTPQTAVVSALRFRPDIVLIDMGLAGTPDAVDVAREINGQLDIPVVFCVGTPDIASLTRTKNLDYATYLLKPINPDSLSTTLDTVLYKYKLERRVRQAEAQFRKLADTCGLLTYFTERGAAAEWRWSPSAGLETERGSLSDTVRERLAEGIAATSAGGIPEKVNFILPRPDGAWAVIGILDRADGRLRGLVIPLNDLPG